MMAVYGQYCITYYVWEFFKTFYSLPPRCRKRQWEETKRSPAWPRAKTWPYWTSEHVLLALGDMDFAANLLPIPP